MFSSRDLSVFMRVTRSPPRSAIHTEMAQIRRRAAPPRVSLYSFNPLRCPLLPRLVVWSEGKEEHMRQITFSFRSSSRWPWRRRKEKFYPTAAKCAGWKEGALRISVSAGPRDRNRGLFSASTQHAGGSGVLNVCQNLLLSICQK